MENQTTTASPSPAPEAPGPNDPRLAFAKVVDEVGNLIESTDSSALGQATPCPEFTVKELLEHMVLVVNRVAAIGRGEHWSTVQAQAVDQGWATDYRAGAHAIMESWGDPAILGTELEVPWGTFPGAVLMYAYTGELAVHGWDLAQATGAEFTIDDALLEGALMGAKFIPAEGRDAPDMPFGPVVDPGTGAPVLDQLAGWMGRDVLA